MSDNTAGSRFNLYDVMSHADEPECCLGEAAQKSNGTTMEPSAVKIAKRNDWKASDEKLERPDYAADFVKEPETIEPSPFVTVDKAALRDLVNAKIERQVVDGALDAVATAVEENSWMPFN